MVILLSCSRLILGLVTSSIFISLRQNIIFGLWNLSQLKQRMFNPKAALERIRRNKNQKEQAHSLTEGVQPLFPSQAKQQGSTSKPDQSIEDRLQKLEMLVANLTEELSNSNETVTKLKRQNSNLETQILKLQYENSQLKSTQVYSQLRRNNSNQKIAAHQSIREEPQKQNQPKKKINSLYDHRSLTISQPKQPEFYSPEVEEIIDNIKQAPIENILRRKEYQYKARKPREKKLVEGNKYLRDLAQIEKNYKKQMKKPVLIIKLDDADFE